MPSHWLNHWDDDEDDGIVSSMQYSIDGNLLEDAEYQCDYADDDDSCQSDLAQSIDLGSRQPMCSTPDAKRRKLEDLGSDLQPKLSSPDISRVKRPMNAFMIWSQVIFVIFNVIFWGFEPCSIQRKMLLIILISSSAT